LILLVAYLYKSNHWSPYFAEVHIGQYTLALFVGLNHKHEISSFSLND
jgi:hypothetical protein